MSFCSLSPCLTEEWNRGIRELLREVRLRFPHARQVGLDFPARRRYRSLVPALYQSKTTGLLFWWPVVQPWPSIARWPRWSTPLYLFLATLPCDALSAFLAFCDRVVYRSYAAGHLAGVSPLRDQEFAGALMWVCITFIYLVPAVVITIQLLSPARLHVSEQDRPDWQRRPAEAL